MLFLISILQTPLGSPKQAVFFCLSNRWIRKVCIGARTRSASWFWIRKVRCLQACRTRMREDEITIFSKWCSLQSSLLIWVNYLGESPSSSPQKLEARSIYYHCNYPMIFGASWRYYCSSKFSASRACPVWNREPDGSLGLNGYQLFIDSD